MTTLSPEEQAKRRPPSVAILLSTRYDDGPVNRGAFMRVELVGLANLYTNLAKGQEPLGTEFEAVWDANVAELYEP